MLKNALKWVTSCIPRSVSVSQAKDSGMALALISILVTLISGRLRLAWLSAALLLIDMIWPLAFKPFAVFWFGFSHMIGTVMSKFIFGIVFAVLVIPIGLLRRLMGKDPLLLKQWKQGRSSVMKVRDHGFTPADISHPY